MKHASQNFDWPLISPARVCVCVCVCVCEVLPGLWPGFFGGGLYGCLIRMYACNHARLGVVGSGGMLPQEIFRNLGQKQSRSTWIAEYCIQFGCHVYAFVKPADIEFP